MSSKPWQGRGEQADVDKELTADCGCTFRCTPVYGPGSVKRISRDSPTLPPTPIGYFWIRDSMCKGHRDFCRAGLHRNTKRSKTPVKHKPGTCAKWMIDGVWTDKSRLEALNHVKSMGLCDAAVQIFRDINCISVHDECPIGSVTCKVWCKASSKLRLKERLERIRRVLNIQVQTQ